MPQRELQPHGGASDAHQSRAKDSIERATAERMHPSGRGGHQESARLFLRQMRVEVVNEARHNLASLFETADARILVGGMVG
jgi:hypothetical protein